MSNLSLEIKTVQSAAFRVLTEALKEILTDANFEIDSIWESYFRCSSYVKIISLTNTLHKIPKSSIELVNKLSV